MALVTDGLPVYWQEPDTAQYDHHHPHADDTDDLIAGEAFLKMLLAVSRTPTSLIRRHSEADTSVTDEAVEVSTLPTTEFQKTVKRETRSPRRGKTYPTPPRTSDNLELGSETSANSLGEGMVISVRVSSSVGKSTINRKVDATSTTTTTTTEIQIVDQTALQSEEHPTIVAEANKSDFSVDEGEPITREANNINLPFHQSVIYHDDDSRRSKEPTRARSVSYSTVIQSLPQRRKDEQQPVAKASGAMAESKDYYVTSKYEHQQLSTAKHVEPTERNWGIPEQNYEVDEAVSVESNGRAHGVQPKQQKDATDDNQKVGYVVEGRNYRKYRVEERTSDGFIVGEYGVVSHNDGSLRGVRYTADGTISPRLIYDALMKFLSL